jgi:hypothetical protein
VAALHRIQWIDAQIRAGTYPNARRLAEQFEISHRQAQRDFEYLRDSLGAPLVYAAQQRGYHYAGETYVLPGPFVTPRQRGVLGNLAEYYARSAQRREDPVLDDIAALFARLSGRDGAAAAWGVNRAPSAGPGVPFLATLSVPGQYCLLDMARLGVPIPPGLQPYHRGGQGPDRIVCEFHDAEAFLSVVLGAWPPFRVEHPAWLRAQLESRLADLRTANARATRCVVPDVVPSGQVESNKRSDTMTAVDTSANR